MGAGRCWETVPGWGGCVQVSVPESSTCWQRKEGRKDSLELWQEQKLQSGVQSWGALVGKGFRIPGSAPMKQPGGGRLRGRLGLTESRRGSSPPASRQGHPPARGTLNRPSAISAWPTPQLPPQPPWLGPERSRCQREGTWSQRGALDGQKVERGRPWTLAANVTGKWFPLPLLGTGKEPLCSARGGALPGFSAGLGGGDLMGACGPSQQ